MALTSKIIPYDSQWPLMFDEEKERLLRVFEARVICIHYVGSTAVPGFAAKPGIDLLVEVVSHQAAHDLAMATIGYQRGKDLSEGHRFYRRNVMGVRTHKVHLCSQGHSSVKRMLTFRNPLRRDRWIREAYQLSRTRPTNRPHSSPVTPSISQEGKQHRFLVAIGHILTIVRFVPLKQESNCRESFMTNFATSGTIYCSATVG